MKDYKYLKSFPKPFLEDIANNRCIPLIGAGFSKNAKIPINETMPNWEELGKMISECIPDFQYTNALDALSAYSFEYSRPNLIEKISDFLLVDQIKPGDTHRAFCELPFELVVTTNFDFLLENTYLSINKNCRPIIEEDQLSISSSNYSVSLLKFHGDLNHPKRLIITEDDYDRFLGTYPMLSTYLSNLLITKTPFFIGYSLDDTDFRQIWQIIADRLGNLRRQAYTIGIDFSQHEIARFERRNVKVINLEGSKSDYAIILSEVFKELLEYWKNAVLKHSTVTEDDSIAELKLPIDVNNRICFVSVPYKLLSFYKKNIFPIIRSYGFIPLTAEDIVSEGNNISASISAIISRSELVIVDASSKNSYYELSLSLNNIKNKNNILIISDDILNNFDLVNYKYYRRSTDPFENIDEIASYVENWFIGKEDFYRNNFSDEPNRLLSKKEYKAAVISAISLLESTLLQHVKYNNLNLDKRRRPISINELLNISVENDLITKNQYKDLREWNYIRNHLVHTNKTINHNQAKKIVSDIYQIIAKLDEMYGV